MASQVANLYMNGVETGTYIQFLGIFYESDSVLLMLFLCYGRESWANLTIGLTTET